MVNYSMKSSKLTKVMIIFSYEQASEKIFCPKPKSACAMCLKSFKASTETKCDSGEMCIIVTLAC